MSLLIQAIPAFDDNYIWLLHDEGSGQTAVVDPGDATPVLAALEQNKWPLHWILNTHHHPDHIGGNAELRRKTGCKIAASEVDSRRIPNVDLALHDGNSFTLGHHHATILFTPGHTKGHISYWFENDRALFCGDTLFIMGCGRLLEGDAPTLWASLSRLTTLPHDTRVFCAHEYTLGNARFAQSIDPNNSNLLERVKVMQALRAQGLPTVPACLGDELATNPFLRSSDPQLAKQIGLEHASALDVFTTLRSRKDRFR